jgi:hypothetical protein
MSVTRKMAAIFLISAVGAWLAFAAWTGATPEEAGRHPLPVDAEPAGIDVVLAKLKNRGIQSAEYDPESRRVIVDAGEEKRAVIALAEEGLLNAFGFIETLERWVLSGAKTKLMTWVTMHHGCANEVARLIENLDSIEDARVIYPNDYVFTLFGGPRYRETAFVRVGTRMGKPLDEGEVNAIIALVAAARTRFDPRDVVVVDQMGNKFRASPPKGLNAMARRRWDYEFSLDEQLRREVEMLVRREIPNIAYGGDVNAFPRHEVEFGFQERIRKTAKRGTTQTGSGSPSEDPVVRLGVRRAAIADDSGYYRTGESSPADIVFAPSVRNLAIFVIIHLPYRIKRDEEGRPIQARDRSGEPLIDPETSLPVWEKESVPSLRDLQPEILRRRIACAAGIPLEEIPEKIDIFQMPWMAFPADGEAVPARAGNWFKSCFPAILALCCLLTAFMFIRRRFIRPVPAGREDMFEKRSQVPLAMAREEEGGK